MIGDYDVEAFGCVLSYLYTGVLKVSDQNVHEVLSIAEMLSLKFVVGKCLEVIAALSGVIMVRKDHDTEKDEPEQHQQQKEPSKKEKEKGKEKDKEKEDQDVGKKRKVTPRKKGDKSDMVEQEGSRDDGEKGTIRWPAGDGDGDEIMDRVNRDAFYMMKDEFSKNKLMKFFGCRRESLPLDQSLREIIGRYETEKHASQVRESWEATQEKLSRFFGRRRNSLPLG